jgi:hypothetical protein
MSDDGNRDFVRRYFDAVAVSDFDALARMRHPDWVEDWPQSGERIRGHDNYRNIHERYPGGMPTIAPTRLVGSDDRWVVTPGLTVQKIIGSGDVWIVEAVNTYANGERAHVAQHLELKDGRVLHATTYFAAPFDPPDWRDQWVEQIPDPSTEQTPTA